MKRVFILGAGASRELKFKISIIDAGHKTIKINDCFEIGPLSSGYFYYFNKLCISLNKDLKILASVKVSDDLMEQIYRGKHTEKPGDGRYVPSSGIHIETKLTG